MGSAANSLLDPTVATFPTGGNSDSFNYTDGLGSNVVWGSGTPGSPIASYGLLVSDNQSLAADTIGGDYNADIIMTGSPTLTSISWFVARFENTPIPASDFVALNNSGGNSNAISAITAVELTNGLGVSDGGWGEWVKPAPEPSSVVLLGLGAIGLYAVARRRRAA